MQSALKQFYLFDCSCEYALIVWTGICLIAVVSTLLLCGLAWHACDVPIINCVVYNISWMMCIILMIICCYELAVWHWN